MLRQSWYSTDIDEVYVFVDTPSAEEVHEILSAILNDVIGSGERHGKAPGHLHAPEGTAMIKFGTGCWGVNTLRPIQNGRHFADDMFKCNSFNEMFWILNKMSLKFVPRGLIDDMSALVEIMAGRRTGDYLKQCWYVLLTHICVTRPQWVDIRCRIQMSQNNVKSSMTTMGSCIVQNSLAFVLHKWFSATSVFI